MKPTFRPLAFDTLDVRTTLGTAASSSGRMSAADPASKLERNYPAMAQAIRLLWGYPEMNEYFSKLWLADDRSEPIDPEVMADLMLLARVHQDLVPTRPAASMASIYGTAYGQQRSRRDIWGDSPRVR